MHQSVHRRHNLLNHELESHSNVVITAVMDGEILKYDSATDTWINGDASVTLASLTDTDITTPAADDILVYDGSDSWDNVSVWDYAYPPQLGHTGI